jgi:hypothetical protein
MFKYDFEKIVFKGLMADSAQVNWNDVKIINGR